MINHSIKHRRAQKIASKLPMANAEILSRIPDYLKERLTGQELACVISAMDESYHAGKASSGAELIDASRQDGAVYVTGLGMIQWREINAEDETITEDSYTNNGETYCGTRTYSRKIKNGELQFSLN